MRDAVGALVVCVRSPEYVQNAASTAHAETDPASRADVRAVLDLMRDVGAVKSCIDEERGGYGDVVGVFVLVGSRSSAVPQSSAADGGGGLRLGADDLDVGDGAADTPFSVGWWEDQLFDLGLCGWEVVEWDPAEQGTEKTRNKFGGKSIILSFISPFADFGVLHLNFGRETDLGYLEKSTKVCRASRKY